jgi:hypothetical protein
VAEERRLVEQGEGKREERRGEEKQEDGAKLSSSKQVLMLLRETFSGHCKALRCHDAFSLLRTLQIV